MMRVKISVVLLALAMAFTLLAGCGQKEEPVPVEKPDIWTVTGVPVHLDYARMYEYGDFVETDDPELIGQIAGAVQSIEVGEPSEEATTDFTDFLTFTFEDGTTVSYEFEGPVWITEDGDRYEVSGLGALRRVLNEWHKSSTEEGE